MSLIFLHADQNPKFTSACLRIFLPLPGPERPVGGGGGIFYVGFWGVGWCWGWVFVVVVGFELSSGWCLCAVSVVIVVVVVEVGVSSSESDWRTEVRVLSMRANRLAAISG